MPTPTLTLAEFRAGFPEFVTAEDSLVLSKLGEAHRCFDAELYGRNFVDAVGYMTAHLLATSPFGTNARTEGETTRYSKRLEELAAMVPATALVIQHRCR